MPHKKTNKFYLSTNFMLDARMNSISKTNQWHFIHLLAIWHDGVLEQNFKDDAARDKVVAKALGIGNGVCRRLKSKLMAAQLAGKDWQPMGEGDLWMTCTEEIWAAMAMIEASREDV